MNLTEVLLATIAAVLVTGGGVYMYGETSDSRAAVRVNEALNLIASNAKAVGPRIAEMSRQDVQKLGIVPESILDRRSMTPNKEANEIAWKSWNAKTGKGGIDLFTAGVREGGKGYFRVYLTGVPSGVCSASSLSSAGTPIGPCSERHPLHLARYPGRRLRAILRPLSTNAGMQAMMASWFLKGSRATWPWPSYPCRPVRQALVIRTCGA